MANPKLQEINDALWNIQNARYMQMRQRIKDAISAGIHVEIIVSTEPGLIMAQELWEQLGFPEGSSDFTHVTLDAIPTNNLWSRGEGLSILYTSIALPRRM